MSEWIAVSKESPCPCCQKPDWCTVGVRFVHCMRIQSDRPCKQGGWLHPREGQTAAAPLPPRERRASHRELNHRFRPILERARKCHPKRIEELAEKLGVASKALHLLECGFLSGQSGGFWTFPEKDARGLVVGYTKRLVTPLQDGRNKLCAKGSSRGLFYIDHWEAADGPVLLVEGASDVAAGLTMGLCVIGRPSNTGGIRDLTALLGGFRRRIIVIGENDRKPDGKWPGKEGAIQTAKLLAKALHRPVGWRLPPNGHKDTRAYLKATGCDVSDSWACYAAGQKFLR